MAKAKVIKGGWRWRGQSYEVGDEVEGPKAQIEAWVETGHVELVEEPKKREERVETAEASAPPENAARRTKKPRWKKKS